MVKIYETRRGSGNNAFTLIELLIVVAIIGILAAMLLPVLSRTKEMARRVVCMNNEKQIYLAMSFFAEQNQNRFPLISDEYKQFNYTIFHKFHNRLYGLGTLWREEFITDPQLFFCPSQLSPVFLYNTVQNPWPPGADVNISCRASYSVRPVFALLMNNSDWTAIEYDAHDYSDFPKMTNDFDTNGAIMSDVMRTSGDIPRSHLGEGVNLLYGDGSVRWRSVSKGDWVGILAPVTSHSASFNSTMDRLWEDFDE